MAKAISNTTVNPKQFKGLIDFWAKELRLNRTITRFYSSDIAEMHFNNTCLKFKDFMNQIYIRNYIENEIL